MLLVLLLIWYSKLVNQKMGNQEFAGFYVYVYAQPIQQNFRITSELCIKVLSVRQKEKRPLRIVPISTDAIVTWTLQLMVPLYIDLTWVLLEPVYHKILCCESKTLTIQGPWHYHKHSTIVEPSIIFIPPSRESISACSWGVSVCCVTITIPMWPTLPRALAAPMLHPPSCDFHMYSPPPPKSTKWPYIWVRDIKAAVV